MKNIDMNTAEKNICGKCGKEAGYYIDEAKMWLCEDCMKIEEKLDKEAERIEKKINKRAYSFNVEELLNSLSKDEIYNIARNLGLAKISGIKKEELINKLVNGYDELINNRIKLFDEERFQFLRSYTQKDCIKVFDEIDEDEVNRSAYFIQQGFIYPTVNDDGKAIFLMPDVVKEIVEDINTLEYRRIFKKNTEIINVFRGMNKAYGILKLDTIKEMFEKILVDNSENEDIENLLTEAGYYYSEYREEGKVFINNYIQDVSKLQLQIDEDINNEYALIPKNELLIMSKPEYNMQIKNGKDFYNEFNKIFNSNKEMVQNIMDEISIEIQENEVKDAITSLLNDMEVNDDEVKSTITSMLNKFSGKVRMWKYKGHSINDINAARRQSIKKVVIGRNDPCICGSGKKYKKCCGKNL